MNEGIMSANQAANGSLSTINRQGKRFFNKNDLKGQTTNRKRNPSDMLIVPQDQIKFNQQNYVNKIDQEEIFAIDPPNLDDRIGFNYSEICTKTKDMVTS